LLRNVVVKTDMLHISCYDSYDTGTLCHDSHGIIMQMWLRDPVLEIYAEKNS